MFAASMVARQIQNPFQRHLSSAKSILRSLETKKNLHLYFPSKIRASMESSCDADWACCEESKKSTTGILVNFNDKPMLWTTKKQTLTALPSGEAEYIASYILGSW